jgi:predicted RNA binding protein YcfA (HicA-like mRNA interferase family)
MSHGIPAIRGEYLVKLLEFDGWQNFGKSTHGITLKKSINDRNLITTIPINKKKPIPSRTLSLILGVTQTQMAHRGLKDLIDRYEKHHR